MKEAKIKVKDFLMWINKTENIGSSEEEICEMAEKLINNNQPQKDYSTKL